MDNKLHKQAFGLMIGLIIQYLMGMAVNLYVSFPEDVHGEEMWKYARSQPLLIIHIFVAFLLLFGASAFVVTSIRKKNALWIKVGLVSFISILISVIAGSIFVPSQNDALSFLMATGFALAIASYGWGLYKSNQKTTK